MFVCLFVRSFFFFSPVSHGWQKRKHSFDTLIRFYFIKFLNDFCSGWSNGSVQFSSQHLKVIFAFNMCFYLFISSLCSSCARAANKITKTFQSVDNFDLVFLSSFACLFISELYVRTKIASNPTTYKTTHKQILLYIFKFNFRWKICVHCVIAVNHYLMYL